MIGGSVMFFSIVILLYLGYSKVKNIITQFQHKERSKSEKTMFRSLAELGLALIAFLFILYSQFAVVQASVEQDFYRGDVYEATQYVSFATYLLPALIFLTFFEIIVGFRTFAVRGRLLPEE